MKQKQHISARDVLRILLPAGALAMALCLVPAGAVEEGHEDHDHAALVEPAHDDHDHEAEAASPAEPGHDEDAEHDDDHAEHETEDDPHAGHDHAEEEGLRLSDAQRLRFGIRTAEAGPGRVGDEVRLSGEIVFNEDRLVHLVPRVAGIALQVNVSVGDPVKARDVLAVIDSAELAAAKLQYFSAVTEVGCCQYELPRAQAIQDNVTRMLGLLDGTPSVEELREAAPGEMGDFRSRLITAYAEYVLTQRAYEREKALLAKEISSEGDYLAAETAYKKALAAYFGTRDSVAYEVRQDVLEATRERQLAEFQARTAEQRLLMLGLSREEVSRLETAVPPDGSPATEEGHTCNDPNCTGCADDEHAAPSGTFDHTRLGWYEIKAPFDGHIVQKHIALGERVGQDSDVFTLVDTDSVWVNLSVYARDLASVHPGQPVVLETDHDGTRARGEIAMVTPFMEHSTRSATARVVLDNRDRRWVPGTFVNGHISRAGEATPVVVPRDAVQRIEDRDVVFVEHGEDLEPVAVVLGHADRAQVEIVSGLEPGTRYVAEGAFQLKATLITSNLDAHAGHGH